MMKENNLVFASPVHCVTGCKDAACINTGIEQKCSIFIGFILSNTTIAQEAEVNFHDGNWNPQEEDVYFHDGNYFPHRADVEFHDGFLNWHEEDVYFHNEDLKLHEADVYFHDGNLISQEEYVHLHNGNSFLQEEDGLVKGGWKQWWHVSILFI